MPLVVGTTEFSFGLFYRAYLLLLSFFFLSQFFFFFDKVFSLNFLICFYPLILLVTL
jgi:hypothetical protein